MRTTFVNVRLLTGQIISATIIPANVAISNPPTNEVVVVFERTKLKTVDAIEGKFAGNYSLMKNTLGGVEVDKNNSFK